jgi:hypothetical protein
LGEGRARIAELLPLAVRLGVPVLAGTDVTGSIPREVALLAQMGLEPQDALAAASTWPRRFLGAAKTADVVTYDRDPRQDPDQLARPAAVVAGGIRLRYTAKELWPSCWRSVGHARRESAGVKVDAHRQRISAHRCRRGHARAAPGCPGRYAAAARAGRHRPERAPFRPSSRRQVRCGP